MVCPSCSHKNRPGAKFCENCGAKLEFVCPNCGTTNRPGAKFCDNCGTGLTGDAASPHVESQPEPESGVTQPIPGDLADKLTTARLNRAMLGERRIVTMLFCDVTGSTSVAERLDPEEWREIINGAFEYMIAPIYRYEGTLARLMGDAILAFFGAPIAHEDDPHRAVLAGLEIVNGIEPYWKSIEEKWGSRLNVRIGINTGLVVVGAVGSDLKMEYTAIGDAINLAARMEQTAGPGVVQVSENTYRLAAPLFEWETLGVQEIRGRAEPVQAYRPIRAREAPGRLRGIEGLTSPLIGRSGDLQ
jgi:class 3 adenylate cyclase